MICSNQPRVFVLDVSLSVLQRRGADGSALCRRSWGQSASCILECENASVRATLVKGRFLSPEVTCHRATGIHRRRPSPQLSTQPEAGQRVRPAYPSSQRREATHRCCLRGGRSLRAKARRSLPPRERSAFPRSGGWSSPHPGEPSAGAPKAQTSGKRGATCWSGRVDLNHRPLGPEPFRADLSRYLMTAGAKRFAILHRLATHGERP
jgi:hypothetical protein